MSENTKKRSLDKLFGTDRTVRPAPEDPAKQPPGKQAEEAIRKAPQSSRKRSTSKQNVEKKSAQNTNPDTQAGEAVAAADEITGEDIGPGGYLGKGRYRRGDGVLVKPSIYMRPDQAHALRMSAAAKNDPNGETMSEIIQTLLDQNGYGDAV